MMLLVVYFLPMLALIGGLIYLLARQIFKRAA